MGSRLLSHLGEVLLRQPQIFDQVADALQVELAEIYLSCPMSREANSTESFEHCFRGVRRSFREIYPLTFISTLLMKYELQR